MSRTSALTSTASLLLVGVLSLSACDVSFSAGDDSSSSSTSSTSQDGESPASPEAAPSDGTQEVTSSRAGLSFEIPQDWQVTDTAAVMADPSSASEDLKNAAEGQGKSIEEYVESFKTLDLLALEADGDDAGFRDNLNVGPALDAQGTVVTTMPTQDEWETLVGQNGEVTTTEEVEGPGGTGLRTDYTYEAGGTTVYATQLAIPTDSAIGIVSLSTSEAATTDELASSIVASSTSV